MDLLAPYRAVPGVVINGTASFTSGSMDCRAFKRLESLMVKVTSVAGTPDVKIEYAVSTDGVTFGDFADEAPILASTSAAFGATPEGVHAISLEGVKRPPYLKIKVTGLGGNPADTICTADLEGRE